MSKADHFDDYMNEGWSNVLVDNNRKALKQIQKAVNLNPDNVHALRLCAVLKRMLGNPASARENFEPAAELLERFTRAEAAGAYPYTSTSNQVYERILGKILPVALPRAPGSILRGSVAVVRDEALVRSFAEAQLASQLPAFCRSQVDTILDQTVHAKLTFTSEISFAQEATSSPTGRRDEHTLKLTLKLKAAKFGVQGCVGTSAKSDALNHGDLLGYLVNDLRIVASPGESWKSECDLSSVRPGDEHNSYPIQSTKNAGYNAGVEVSAGMPTVTTQMNHMNGRTVTSLPCGWVQSSKASSSGTENDWASRWILSMYQDGHRIALDKPVRKIRELPFNDPCNVNYPSLDAGPCYYDATWTIPLVVAEELNYKFDFKITVTAGVVLLPRSRLRDLVKTKPITDSVSFSSTIHCLYFDSVVKLITDRIN